MAFWRATIAVVCVTPFALLLLATIFNVQNESKILVEKS